MADPAVPESRAQKIDLGVKHEQTKEVKDFLVLQLGQEAFSPSPLLSPTAQAQALFSPTDGSAPQRADAAALTLSAAPEMPVAPQALAQEDPPLTVFVRPPQQPHRAAGRRPAGTRNGLRGQIHHHRVGGVPVTEHHIGLDLYVQEGPEGTSFWKRNKDAQGNFVSIESFPGNPNYSPKDGRKMIEQAQTDPAAFIAEMEAGRHPSEYVAPAAPKVSLGEATPPPQQQPTATKAPPVRDPLRRDQLTWM